MSTLGTLWLSNGLIEALISRNGNWYDENHEDIGIPLTNIKEGAKERSQRTQESKQKRKKKKVDHNSNIPLHIFSSVL